MRWRSYVLGVLLVLALQLPTSSSASAAVSATPDYSPATWVPADPSNYSVADRTHDYPIDMIVIHDIEGTAATGIKLFQTPGYGASAHYVIGYDGSVTQMVQEKDIAWHAGNWDYNTRSIGIEHAGYAATGGYTFDEYQASAQLTASICSRYGVPMDRNHVIGHYQVPDPNNPGLYGGEDHHTDPGPYWNWTYYMSYANIYAQRLPSPPHLMTHPTFVPFDGGATISWTVQTCHLPVASYTVTVNPGNMTFTLPGTATSTSVHGLTNGQPYTATVTATNADGSDSTSAMFIPSPPCTAPTLSAVPASGATGSGTVFTASASTCSNPNYEFWVQPPGGSWSVAQDYSASNTFNWAGTSTAGAYRFEVDTRQQTSSVAYDAVDDISYPVAGCSAIKLTADSTPPQMPGIKVTLTGTATCPGTPQYRFWRRSSAGRWTIVQDYGPSNTYVWDTTGFPLDTYYLEVDVRDVGVTATYEVVSNMTYKLGPPPCTTAGLSASPASPQAAGSQVTWTGTSTGCANPRYRFWELDPGRRWSMVQDYSASNTYTWHSPAMAGNYEFEVDVRDALETTAYDIVNDQPYVLKTAPACTAATLSVSPASPGATGIAVTMTGGSSTCPNPRYRFWVSDPGSRWSMVQDYSAANTHVWAQTFWPGVYRMEVDVRDASETTAYDVVYNTTYTLDGCTGATLSGSPASAVHGAGPIVLTATATCPGTPTYRFWVEDPGNRWSMVQDFSTSATFTWPKANQPAAGVYHIEVDVRDQGSQAVYEYATSGYTYTMG